MELAFITFFMSGGPENKFRICPKTGNISRIWEKFPHIIQLRKIVP
jgi:hypothetical protein